MPRNLKSVSYTHLFPKSNESPMIQDNSLVVREYLTTVKEAVFMLPKNATYYFTKASVKRALSEKELQSLAMQSRLHGDAYPCLLYTSKNV